MRILGLGAPLDFEVAGGREPLTGSLLKRRSHGDPLFSERPASTSNRTQAIRVFALRHRCRLTCDECGEQIVAGKHGHVFDYGDGALFGVLLLDNPPSQPSKTRALLRRRKEALAAGFVPGQIGECESVLLFRRDNVAQAQLALQLVGARLRRRLSPKHRRRLFEASRDTRYSVERTVLGRALE